MGLLPHQGFPLRQAALGQPRLVPGAQIQGVDGQALLQQAPVVPAQQPQQRPFEHPALLVVPVAHQGVLHKAQGLLQLPLAGGEAAQPVEPGALGFGAPGGFVKGVKGFPLLAGGLQSQAQVEPALPGVGIGILPRLLCDGRPEIGQARRRLATAVQQQPIAVVQPDVRGVPPQPFQVVVLRVPGGVAVLLQVGGGQVQLLGGGQLPGLGQRLRRVGDGLQLGLPHLQRRQELPLGPDLHPAAGQASRHRRLPLPAGGGGEVRLGPEQFFPRPGESYLRLGILPRGVDFHQGLPFPGGLQAEGGVLGGVAHPAHALVGHEILGEGLFLLGFQPGEVRLVVGEHPGHQLNVGAVLVGEVPVPAFAKVAAAPGPLLFPRGDVVVRHVEQPGLAALVVVADEVVVRVGRHVRGGHLDVLVPGDVHPGGVVELVVFPRGDGEGGNRPAAVVHHRVYVRREHGVGVLVHRHGGVGPPQEGLGQVRRVVQPPLYLNVGLPRVQGDGRGALGAVHPVCLPHKHRAGAVLPPLQGVVHRGEGGGPVVLGPVELNAPGHPGAAQPHQGGLYHVVVVDKVVAVCLVQRPLDAPPQLGQHHHLQVLVLQKHRLVGYVLLLVGDFLRHWEGVHLPRAALVGPVLQKQRGRLRTAGTVGGDGDFFFPNLHLAHGALLLLAAARPCFYGYCSAFWGRRKWEIHNNDGQSSSFVLC